MRGEDFLRIAHQQLPKTMKLLLTSESAEGDMVSAIDEVGLNGQIRKPWETQGLLLNVETLLIRYELATRLSEHQGALERKNTHLEALHRVGVTLAGSFDIDSILHQISEAAAQLVGEAPIDIFYIGSQEINSRSRWLPRTPASGNLTAEDRLRLEKTLKADNGEACATPSDDRLELELSRLPDGRERHLVPITHRDELLGWMIVKPKAVIDKEAKGLLYILSLQAATALRNIHLTQERIHFERLSAFGRMIGSVVHDFRSPLTAIRGYAGMLGGMELPPREREEYAGLAIEECDRLNGMINELLEFTRGGRAKLRLRKLRLGDYLEDLRPAILAHFEGGGVHFEMDLAYDGTVFIDPDRMGRAVLNMASNASQALNGNGVFTIRTERRGAQVILEFRDTGCGIPEEIRHRIFEPFFSYGKAQGIGLGMSITRKIVEEHGGKVALSSEVGSGTRIRFLLPLKPEGAYSSEDPDEGSTQEPVETASSQSR
jgi:signal transduction histidine kinase